MDNCCPARRSKHLDTEHTKRTPPRTATIIVRDSSPQRSFLWPFFHPLLNPLYSGDHLSGFWPGLPTSCATLHRETKRSWTHARAQSLCWVSEDLGLARPTLGTVRNNAIAPPHLVLLICLCCGLPKLPWRWEMCMEFRLLSSKVGQFWTDLGRGRPDVDVSLSKRNYECTRAPGVSGACLSSHA